MLANLASSRIKAGWDLTDVSGLAEFEDCYATWSHDTLVIGNGSIERRWRLGDGGIEGISLFDKATGYQWIAQPHGPSPSVFGSLVGSRYAVTAEASPNSAVSLVSLNVHVEVTADKLAAYKFSIFPKLAAVAVSACADIGSDAALAGTRETATGIEVTPEQASSAASADNVDAFSFTGIHYRLRHIELVDQTDHHNELAKESEYRLHMSEVALRLRGNLFAIEDVLTGAGIAHVKLTALPGIRPKQDAFDIEVDRGLRVRVVGLGISPESGEGYRTVSMLYHGGRHGLTAALQSLQLAIRQYVPGRDGQFLSNTWGDRGQDSRIAESFLLTEVAAGAKVGVDVVQIDDGWQVGRTANSALSKGGVWEGFRAQREFWSVDPAKFPAGLEPLTAAQKETGQRLGLWFAPDSADDFANWRADADTLLDLHKRHGIDFFKLDGIKLRTVRGEGNLQKFFAAVRDDSGGKIICDLDVTAETRPGYFGAIEAGPVFVENRYTDWRSYWPHATLRNVWKLAQYLPSVRLRMELLNNERNVDKYEGDPLAPSAYSASYLFAITMIASPLGWFEMSGLSARYIEDVAPLVATWKRHRGRLHSGTVYPVGTAPDGTSWTGFVCRPADGAGGYLLAFRELNALDRHTFSLDGLVESGPVEVLAGDGTATIARDLVTVTLPERLSFAFVKID